ncbi:MAG TPA: CDP-alcohol phosphatidyltransferase family protein [Longimicrobiales bacterium]|nr:CDP-alcohol phosphatidyltransferase family protein [Longimicrobiales bacterium]
MSPRPSPADHLTAFRLLALPVLWALAVTGRGVALGIGLALAGLTDVLDGPVARRTGRSTRFGSQLDSIADLLLMGSTVVWMALLQPGFFAENARALLVWVGIGAASVVVTWVRLGRFGDLHLYSAKAAGVVGYVFAVWLFILADYSPAFWTVTIGLAILAASETLLAALLRRPDEPWTGTILTRLR